MKTDPEKIALFDMDGTLCNFSKAIMNGFDLLNDHDQAEEAIELFDQGGQMPDWVVNQYDMIKQRPGFWRDLEPISSGFMILKMAQEIGFTPHILTKGPKRTTSAWTEKVEWCHAHLGNDIDITITQDKGLFYGRVLVDDFPNYMNRWLEWRPRGLGIMPVADNNKTYIHPCVVMFDETHDSYMRVQQALQKAFDREPVEV